MALHLKDFSMLRELHGSKQTIVVAPPECHQHITGPVPVLRGGQEPPPENVNRLHVLTDSGNNLSLCSLKLWASGRPPYGSLLLSSRPVPALRIDDQQSSSGESISPAETPLSPLATTDINRGCTGSVCATAVLLWCKSQIRP